MEEAWPETSSWRVQLTLGESLVDLTLCIGFKGGRFQCTTAVKAYPRPIFKLAYFRPPVNFSNESKLRKSCRDCKCEITQVTSQEVLLPGKVQVRLSRTDAHKRKCVQGGTLKEKGGVVLHKADDFKPACTHAWVHAWLCAHAHTHTSIATMVPSGSVRIWRHHKAELTLETEDRGERAHL